MSRSTRAKYSSTSPVNEPVALRCAMMSRKLEPGFTILGRQPVHLDVALVADHEPLRGVEQQQALRHVVDGACRGAAFPASAARERRGAAPAACARSRTARPRWRARKRRRPRSGCRSAPASRPAPPRASWWRSSGSGSAAGRARRSAGPRRRPGSTRRAGEVVELEDLLLLERAGLEIPPDHLAGHAG